MPAVNPSVVPGTCYSPYIKRYEIEIAAHNLSGQSEPPQEQLCNCTVSPLSPISLCLLQWSGKRAEGLRIQFCYVKTKSQTQNRCQRALHCVQLLCSPVILSNFSQLFSLIPCVLWITSFHFCAFTFPLHMVGAIFLQSPHKLFPKQSYNETYNQKYWKMTDSW